MLACVTGGTGFAGSYIVRALLEDNHQVRVLHRSTSKLDALAGLDYDRFIGDVTDKASLEAVFKECDWVFHVAAVADYWRADTRHMNEININGTRKVLEAAQLAGVQRVIFTSSAAAIGVSQDGTSSDETVAFNLPPEQFAYGYSKALAENIVQEFVNKGLDVVTVNPVVIIGPGDLNMISGSYITQVANLQWLVPKASGSVAVTDVRDVAQSHLAAAKKGISGERYILMTDNLSNHEWFAMIAEVAGVAPPVIPVPDSLVPAAATIIGGLRRLGIQTPVNGDQVRLGAKHMVYDGSKAHQHLYTPQIPIRQSVEESYQWFVEQGYLSSTILTRTLQAMSRLWHHPQNKNGR